MNRKYSQNLMAFIRQNGLLLFRVSHLKLLDKLTVFCGNHLTPGRIKNHEKESHPMSEGFVNMNIKKTLIQGNATKIHSSYIIAVSELVFMPFIIAHIICQEG